LFEKTIPLLETSRCTLDADTLGLVHSMIESSTQFTVVAAAVPKRQVRRGDSKKLVPLITTTVPPSTGPDITLMDDTVGVAETNSQHLKNM
jgi:hypothetical protein